MFLRHVVQLASPGDEGPVAPGESRSDVRELEDADGRLRRGGPEAHRYTKLWLNNLVITTTLLQHYCCYNSNNHSYCVDVVVLPLWALTGT